MIPLPRHMLLDPAYAPVIALVDSVNLLASEVSKHLRLTEDTLSNMRRRGTGPAYTKLPSGRVLYPLSGVLEWEIAGQGGAVTPERLSLALATVPGLDVAMRQRIEAQLSHLLFSKRGDG